MHVRELGLAAAADDEILGIATDQRRVLVSRDADFAGLLAQGGLRWPSFVHLRIAGLHDPGDQAMLLSRILEQLAEELTSGAVVTVQAGRVRVRALPVSRER